MSTETTPGLLAQTATYYYRETSDLPARRLGGRPPEGKVYGPINVIVPPHAPGEIRVPCTRSTQHQHPLTETGLRRAVNDAPALDCRGWPDTEVVRQVFDAPSAGQVAGFCGDLVRFR